MHAGQASTLPTERQFQPLSRGQLHQEQAVVPVLFRSGQVIGSAELPASLLSHLTSGAVLCALYPALCLFHSGY